MGTIADRMIAGEMCSLCGVIFKDPDTGDVYAHEHPVVCQTCWGHLTVVERDDYQQAVVDTF